VEEGGQLGVVPTMWTSRRECIRLEDRWQSIARIRLISHVRKMVQMPRNLTLMPRGNDRLEVGEVLVESCSTDPRRFRDLRHRHGEQPARFYEAGRSIEDRFTYLASMRLDRR
jgi:hypothetical protein